MVTDKQSVTAALDKDVGKAIPTYAIIAPINTTFKYNFIYQRELVF
jgi:hypothetical protein